jgi:hypothetical protein
MGFMASHGTVRPVLNAVAAYAAGLCCPSADPVLPRAQEGRWLSLQQTHELSGEVRHGNDSYSTS